MKFCADVLFFLEEAWAAIKIARVKVKVIVSKNEKKVINLLVVKIDVFYMWSW